MNLCRSCGLDFSSLSAFDRHRVGKHELDWPEHPDGRRCMSEPEMVEGGMEIDPRGRWRDAVSEQDRQRLQGWLKTLPGTPQDASKRVRGTS